MRIHLSALGCRLNEAELERWATDFASRGHKIARQPETADVLVMNTCAVTKEAVRKSRQRITRLKRSNPMAKLVVSGCYSELETEHALAELGIDLVVPNSQKENLVPLTAETFSLTSMPQAATLPAESVLFERNRHRAFIKIQDGCRYKCAFCIVTVARGNERSRKTEDIVNEVRQLHEGGVQEIVLTGVHVGGYGSDLDTNLASLVATLLDETDIPRIRFASVEPWDLSDGFLDLFENTRVQPHMHLPLQSGCDITLRRMARRCKTTDYAQLTQSLRDRVATFNVTTDIIVGFPGETDEHWQRSLEFINTQNFGHIHVFSYSERQGTRAASMPDQIPIEIRQQRSKELHELSDKLKLKQLNSAIDSSADVLWERGKPVSKGETRGLHQYHGYTPNYLRVSVNSCQPLANSIWPIRLTQLKDGKLTGDLLTQG